MYLPVTKVFLQDWFCFTSYIWTGNMVSVKAPTLMHLTVTVVFYVYLCVCRHEVLCLTFLLNHIEALFLSNCDLVFL
jgi:succinate-acetate transporter protein